ncbi:FkbM family methyltransferase, partial [Paracoccaceae bacterium]|nr:FkbM family methyltransferase [Paracoccaceae bacterium]
SRTEGRVFCLLFNLRSKILNLNLRVKISDDYYQLLDKRNSDFQHFFRAEKQGNMAYGKGLEARLKDLSDSYFLEKIDFCQGDTFIDCGANVGDMFLLIQNFKNHINYIGFEPSPNEYKCLQKNAKGMVTYNLGLWKEEGELEFFVSSQGADSSLVRPKVFDSKITVKTARLENFITGNVKCLKLEAEGAEPEILQGLGEKLRLIEYITADVGFERGEDEDSTLAPVSNFLLKNNFKMVAIGKRRLCVLFKNSQFG